MSTKIYNAWRVPVSRLNALIDHVRARAIEHLVKHVRSRMCIIQDDHANGHHGPDWKPLTRFEAWHVFEKQLAAGLHDDLIMWLNVWNHGRYFYVMGCGVADFMPKWVEDYSYYDNTDHPKGITQRAWQQRGEVWKRICTGEGTAGHNARRLEHVILSKDGHPSFEVYKAVLLDWGRDGSAQAQAT